MGETTDVGVAELLSVLARRGHTGRLHINSDGEEVQVILNGGKVIQVSSSHHSLRIGRILVRLGVLQEEELNEAVKEQVGQLNAKPLGQILTAHGLATQSDLALAAEEQATDALSRIFGAQDGTFFFTGLAAEETRPGLVALNAEGIVLEASRRADEIEALRRMMPADDVQLELNRAMLPIGQQLPEYQQRIVRVLGMEPLTVSGLLSQLADDERAVLRAIVGLQERGIIQLRHPSQDDGFEPPVEVTIAPRKAAEIRALIAEPAGTGDPGMPRLDQIQAAYPAGTQSVARATRVVREVVGAFNAGLPLLAFAHFTDAYFRRLSPASEEELASLDRLGEPVADHERQTFIELRDVRTLVDGRITGIAVTTLPGGAPTQKVVIFTDTGGRCRIDGIIDRGQERGQQTQTALLGPAGLIGADRPVIRSSF